MARSLADELDSANELNVRDTATNTIMKFAFPSITGSGSRASDTIRRCGKAIWSRKTDVIGSCDLCYRAATGNDRSRILSQAADAGATF
jgi:hypothetical protein